MKNKKKIQTLILFLFVCVTILFFQGFYNTNNRKIDSSLLELTSGSPESAAYLVWITFEDKGPTDKINDPALYLTERSIQRRIKTNTDGHIADFSDIPVYLPYIEELEETGIKIKQRSRWYNSISCYASREQIDEMIEKDYVKKIELVAVFGKSMKEQKNLLVESNTKNTKNIEVTNDNSSVDYGASLQQSQIINVVQAHNNGYMGQGILIASFDTGVDNLLHPTFDSMRVRGMRTYDFVNGDTNIANQPGQQGEGSHGTLTLSLVGGYSPGNLISPAFRSKYIVAKTENTVSEMPIEEDNWIAAAEWADSLGADIITSSLGYLGFDSGSAYSYDWTWMNGDSCKITRAADLAVNKGIIVVNSAGNNGFNPSHNTLNAPADGDSVLTIGSIDFDGQRLGFSSVGPTTDGRSKPDVMAVGSGNVTAQPGPGNTGFVTGASGTSLSAPMVAGVCAIMLSANNNLTPMHVVNILRNTSSNAGSPNSLIGWGTINAWNAVQQALTISIGDPTPVPTQYVLGQNYPNPFNPVTIIPFSLSRAGRVQIDIYNTLGEKITTLVNKTFTANSYEIPVNSGELNLSSGIYYYTLTVNNSLITAKKMTLLK